MMAEEAKYEPHEAFIWMQGINNSFRSLLNGDTYVEDARVLGN